MSQGELFESDACMSSATARARRDHCIEAVGAHAGPGWVDRAVMYVVGFARFKGAAFLAEEARIYAEGFVDSPHDGRAWGAVFKVAAKRGLIRRDGFGMARSSNMSPKPLWVGC